MKVGDLVDFDFQDIYSGVVVYADEKIVKVLFLLVYFIMEVVQQHGIIIISMVYIT